MPTYTFECTHDTCHHEWDEVLSIKAPDPEECPKCKNKDCIKRLINGGTFILQGSGWAKDSYSK